jgi:hypothetical protein
VTRVTGVPWHCVTVFEGFCSSSLYVVAAGLSSDVTGALGHMHLQRFELRIGRCCLRDGPLLTVEEVAVGLAVILVELLVAIEPRPGDAAGEDGLGLGLVGRIATVLVVPGVAGHDQ